MRRIQRDVQHEEFIKSLTSGESAIFRDIWRVLLFAASFGIYLGERRPLQKVESNKAMPESYFSTPGWRGFLYLIGFLENDSSDHLRKEDDQEEKLVTAFEEYANRGLDEMRSRMQSPSSALSDLVGI
ncbi:MAG: DNA phosphorothioation-associated protein 4, partial [Verrucomicrobiae bacterium]|nr:DNA phosphorothioation-associated protein 4 [Verrucomicrobiae bacterium]